MRWAGADRLCHRRLPLPNSAPRLRSAPRVLREGLFRRRRTPNRPRSVLQSLQRARTIGGRGRRTPSRAGPWPPWRWTQRRPRPGPGAPGGRRGLGAAHQGGAHWETPSPRLAAREGPKGFREAGPSAVIGDWRRQQGTTHTHDNRGSGPRHQVLTHVFARCTSKKTHGHARIARVSESHAFQNRTRFRIARVSPHGRVRVFFDSRNVQKSVTQVICLGPLPTTTSCGEGCRWATFQGFQAGGDLRLLFGMPGPARPG